MDYGPETLISDWLRQRRKQLDKTQHELAEQVGCSTVLIRKIESGERRPSRQVAARLAEALQVPAGQHERFVELLRQSVYLIPQDFEHQVAQQTLPGAAVPHTAAPPADARPTTAPPASGLPEYASAFVGRQAELEQVVALLAGEARLLTLVGAGGMGKTRLAVEAARSLAELEPGPYPAGIHFAALAGVAAPAGLPEALANALGVRVEGRVIAARLAALLPGRRLLVLDNYEHLLPEGLDLIAGLLEAAPELSLLVTSRYRLGLAEEWVFEIAGLAYPPVEAPEESLPADWEQFSAVQLFAGSARRSGVGFAVSPHNAAAVRQVCALVEGLPLGLELAAAWTRLLPVSEIAAEIQRNLDFLTSSLRDVPDRHRSLRAAFEYSWSLLSNGEQQALAALALLSGPFEREAAEQVAGAGLLELAGLLDKSLLARAPGGRYELHPLLRQYAREKLEASGALENAQVRLLEYCCQRTRLLDQAYQQGQVEAWRSGLEGEQANCETALQFALETRRAENGLLLAEALWRFWYTRGALAEGAAWLQRLLDLGVALPDERLGRAWYCLASLEHHQGAYDAARQHLADSLQASRQAGDRETIAAVTNELGLLDLDHGRPQAAEEYFREGLAAMQALGDRHGEALLGYNLGRALYARGLHPQAQEHWQASLALAQQIGDLRVQMYACYMLGVHALEAGELGAAREQIALSLIHSERLGDRFMRTWSLDRMAMLELQAGNPQLAVRHYALSAVLREQSLLAVPPVHQDEYQAFERDLRQALAPEVYQQLWQAGQQQAREEFASEQAGVSVHLQEGVY